MTLRYLTAGAALTLAAVIAAGSGLSSAQTGPNWPTFGGSNTRNAVSSASGPASNTAANEWQLPGAVESSPAVYGTTAYIGDDNGKVYALSTSNPRDPLWSFTTQGKVTAAPTVSPDGKVVYVGSNDGLVYALNASNGSKLWSQPVGSSVQASPLLSTDGGTLYVPLVGGAVKALSASSGSTSWSTPINGTIAGSLALSPDGSTIYAATYSSQLMYGIPSSGAKGATLTPYYLNSPAVSTPAVGPNGNIYVTTVNGTLMAFNAGNSTAIWSYTVPSRSPSNGSPTVANGNVYFGDGDQNFYAVNASNGQLNWTVHTGGAIESSPAVATGNSLVFFGSDDGVFYALSASSGALQWSKSTGAAVSSSPAIGPDGSVWVGSHSGIVYRFSNVTPPPVPSGTPSSGATSTPSPTATAGPTSTGTAPTLSLALTAQVKAGSRQTITITGPANTLVHIRVAYPNGDHQSKGVTTSAGGSATYSYTQGSSKIKHNRFYATVTAKTASKLTATKQYKILFGKIDTSIEPRTQKAGKTVSIWIHTGVKKKVIAVLHFPNKHVKRISGKTGRHGWAHLHYKVGKKLTKGKNHKVTVTASNNKTSTKSFFTIK